MLPATGDMGYSLRTRLYAQRLAERVRAVQPPCFLQCCRCAMHARPHFSHQACACRSVPPLRHGGTAPVHSTTTQRSNFAHTALQHRADPRSARQRALDAHAAAACRASSAFCS